MENPKVVFVGGQPGAGKTKLFKLSMDCELIITACQSASRMILSSCSSSSMLL
ncbi:MAG: zeta toxin family protein [Cyanobacteria bacterium REEB67]|nr:zeta toxin family protein [Cyanobacteria bacterium REEB67]